MISVIIPTYNRAELLKRAAQSVLAQTYKDFELIIVDDGSTDNTKEIVESLNDSRIVYVYQKNAGACVARNNGIEHAKGEYIAFHDSDDVWHSNKLELQMQALIANNADVVFCKMNRYQDGKVVEVLSTYFKEGFLAKDNLPFAIGTQTIFGKAEVFKNTKFDPEMPRFQEFEMLIRAQKKYSIFCLDKPLVDYFIQNDSISAKPKKYLLAWKLILSKHKKLIEEYKASSDRMGYNLLKFSATVKDRTLKYELIKLAFKFKQSPRMVYRLIKFLLKGCC
ncbi:glycosyltransferase family 2 protein [Hallerella porci]|uniref:Glycosyltransferase involved in cell wall biosynthesis n=1 Tax=Hallerella porci TaxID=1945871 RepID=A0ABX5LI77_9BACT|nr:glycosyltransferase family 2 protein [Hallerella porci]PWK93146.1 glycosyltransferase involved in cell wall biosynthesis [Hallerella porci]